jgi:hypothetical protein
MMAVHAVYVLGFASALAYLALRFWRWKKSEPHAGGVEGFHPQIGYSNLDGMQSLSLLLENESHKNVWVEEIDIFLSELVANNQAAQPSCHEVLRIRQVAAPEDTLPISLAGVIYKAAGEPQREYSCTLSSVLRFRVGQEWFEKNLENYQIHMLGLTAAGIRRTRKPVPQLQIQEQHQDIAAVAARTK